MKRLKQLDNENSRLKTIVTDLTLDREMLQDVIRRKTDKGDLRNACALWVSARARAAAPGRLGDQHEEDSQDLQ